MPPYIQRICSCARNTTHQDCRSWERTAGLPCSSVHKQEENIITKDQIHDLSYYLQNDTTDRTGIPIYQETHRNKWSYAAHIVKPILEKYPDTLLTFDVSHWFCVSESYLEDQQAAVEKALIHARHIHARVGHTGRPAGVRACISRNTPHALNAHLAIWDRYVQLRREAGARYLHHHAGIWSSSLPGICQQEWHTAAGTVESEPVDERSFSATLLHRSLTTSLQL